MRFPIKPRVLILPHFEVGEMSGDFPGEAQYFYEHYFKNGETLTLLSGSVAYVNADETAVLAVTGSGKTLSALCLSTLLSDSRFDFSQAYIFAPGCAGGNYETTVSGDICVVASVCDFDLGHFADCRDFDAKEEHTGWFRGRSYDESARVELNAELTLKVYDLLKAYKPETTPLCEKIARKNAVRRGVVYREPQTLIGAALTGDSFWKGRFGHKRAIQIARSYETKYPYAVTEMEDTAIAVTAEKFGMLSRLIILRAVVNDDLIPEGQTPFSLWSGNTGYNEGVKNGETTETADIFPTAMKNLFEAGKTVLDGILAGRL